MATQSPVNRSAVIRNVSIIFMLVSGAYYCFLNTIKKDPNNVEIALMAVYVVMVLGFGFRRKQLVKSVLSAVSLYVVFFFYHETRVIPMESYPMLSMAIYSIITVVLVFVFWVALPPCLSSVVVAPKTQDIETVVEQALNAGIQSDAFVVYLSTLMATDSRIRAVLPQVPDLGPINRRVSKLEGWVDTVNKQAGVTEEQVDKKTGQIPQRENPQGQHPGGNNRHGGGNKHGHQGGGKKN